MTHDERKALAKKWSAAKFPEIRKLHKAWSNVSGAADNYWDLNGLLVYPNLRGALFDKLALEYAKLRLLP
jgi:hypothetical protein